jgi:phosphatidylethanolamine/phosphatidyl-N-methylethanolamine N-methyltransferase
MLLSPEFAFFRRFIAEPLSVASPLPSGAVLVERIAAQVDPALSGQVLELGPGTGAVTRAILARGVSSRRLVAIEQDTEFVRRLRDEFHGVTFFEGNAFRFSEILAPYLNGSQLSAVVCGLPVLSQPLSVREALLRDAASLLRSGAPFIQFSYSFRPPLPRPTGGSAECAATVWRNLPPMHIWTYRFS